MSQSRTKAPIIKSIHVIPPHSSLRTPAEAIAFMGSFDESRQGTSFTPYEVDVRYSNGNEIRGQFQDKATAIAFLRGMR